jgi:hypothetical protein
MAATRVSATEAVRTFSDLLNRIRSTAMLFLGFVAIFALVLVD